MKNRPNKDIEFILKNSLMSTIADYETWADLLDHNLVVLSLNNYISTLLDINVENVEFITSFIPIGRIFEIEEIMKSKSFNIDLTGHIKEAFEEIRN